MAVYSYLETVAGAPHLMATTNNPGEGRDMHAFKLPQGATIGPAPKYKSVFVYSPSQGFSYSATVPNLNGDGAYAFSVALDGQSELTTTQWVAGGVRMGEAEDVIHVPHTHHEFVIHGSMVATTAHRANPGDLFVTNEGTFIAVKPVAPGAPSILHIDVGNALYHVNGYALATNDWSLRVYNGEEVIFERRYKPAA